MDDEWIDTISKRYIELFEKVTGRAFVAESIEDDLIEAKVVGALERLGLFSFLGRMARGFGRKDRIPADFF
jgi:hypothetical protein